MGHTYDLDAANMWDNMWDRMEAIFRRVAACPDVAFMTTLEIVRYLTENEFLHRYSIAPSPFQTLTGS